MPSGEKTGKLTTEQVAEFKANMYEGELKAKAERLGVSLSALCQIRAGVTWRNVQPSQKA